MTLLERLKNAGISTEDIIYTFQFKSGIYSNNGKRSYTFGSSKDPQRFWGEIYFNAEGELHKIVPGNLLVSEKSQSDFVENALNDINGDHGYIISHRILFSQRPLRGKFQWKDDFRIRPCLNTSQIGKGLAWGLDDYDLNDTEKHLGPPYPFILEVRTKKSSNHLIQTNRYLEALDLYQWLLGLLIPHLLGSPVGRNGQPKWIMLKNENTPEYHLAFEAFNAHESEVETSADFSVSNSPDVARYLGDVDYYNHIWSQSSEIELPVEMEEYLNLFNLLPKESKENFRRSLYWFNIGSRLFNQEQLSIIPFTIAVECLLPNPSSKVCQTCNKPSGDGPTKLFKQFMEKHLSLPENIDNLKKSIYPKRSSMIHGSFAFAADQGFCSIGNFDNSEFITESFVRRALVNWLVKGDFMQDT
jgi:hypothetical protein